jgi:hypothetical protein
MSVEPYYCEANPSKFYPNLKRAGDMLEMEGEGARVFLYWSFFNYDIPCMYCGASSEEDGLAFHTVSGTPYQIIYCVSKCMSRANKDVSKVNDLFQAYRNKTIQGVKNE